ncbi:hypothetical protein STRDD10_01301 [Streptococcus sp. DD10]|nr:hypothetical protein STRDD10_01301 [Streptococcus sp. DD10]
MLFTLDKLMIADKVNVDFSFGDEIKGLQTASFFAILE